MNKKDCTHSVVYIAFEKHKHEKDIYGFLTTILELNPKRKTHFDMSLARADQLDDAEMLFWLLKNTKLEPSEHSFDQLIWQNKRSLRIVKKVIAGEVVELEKDEEEMQKWHIAEFWKHLLAAPKT